MNRNAGSASAFFSLPPKQVIELRAQVRIQPEQASGLRPLACAGFWQQLPEA